MFTFETALKFWWGLNKWWAGARGAYFICYELHSKSAHVHGDCVLVYNHTNVILFVNFIFF